MPKQSRNILDHHPDGDGTGKAVLMLLAAVLGVALLLMLAMPAGGSLPVALRW